MPQTPPPAPGPSPEELMERIARAAAAYYRHFATVAAGHGLTLMQGKTLSLLARPRPMRALADLLACDASNVTGIVDRLAAQHLVRRESDPADRRIKNIVLTEQGEHTVRRIRDELMSCLTAVEQLTPAERDTLHTLLGRAFPETITPHGA